MTTLLTRLALVGALALGFALTGFASSPAEARIIKKVQVRMSDRASAVMLNPQPLPPGPCKVCGVQNYNRHLNAVR